jgi:choice-of-anchor A domain-containing protein
VHGDAARHERDQPSAADPKYLNTSYGFQVNSTYSDATIVINVPGTSDSTPNNWLFSGISAQHVLLNFSSAASLTLSSYVAASVLAPNASVNAPAPGHLDGTFIAGSFSSGQYQFNSAPFTGTLPDFTRCPPRRSRLRRRWWG